ncbi:DUF4307 domain-containing protein [Corynebacterium sp. sy039]|uniref:DUF4307 domain-containing protein n=1 Tax=Corynebacterium sp. sy039 TaxID=2599641 RepID=UPI001FEE862D|nr:DUF4307 domain-containing protein [Corynebacterium sp. sy039]
MTSPQVRATTRQRYSHAADKHSNFSGKIFAILIVVIVFCIVIAAVRFFQARGDATVQGKTGTVERIDDRTFRLGADITRTKLNEPTYCIVKALNYDMAEVGRREVVIPAGGKKLERVNVDITTTEPAVSATVYGCSENIPFYLDIPSR